MFDKIKERAYFLWEEAGCPENRSEEFWLKAEQELGNIDFSSSEEVTIELTQRYQSEEYVPTQVDRRTFLKRAYDFVKDRSWLVPFA